MNKFCLLSAALILTLASAACGRTEKTEAVTADIEAAQMQGKEAARWLLHQEIADSAELSLRAEQARARKYELEKEGKKEEAAAFDSAFVKTVKAVDPKYRYKW